ncbi:MAG: hypothetical protein V1855_02575, partial [bacterium]
PIEVGDDKVRSQGMTSVESGDDKVRSQGMTSVESGDDKFGFSIKRARSAGFSKSKTRALLFLFS